MKLYGVILYRWNELSERHLVDKVRVFESQERRDKLAHAYLMKGNNFETFETEMEE